MAPTRTSSNPTTARRVGASRGRPAAAAKPRRTPTLATRRRKPAPESNAKKVLGAVTSALPGLIEKAGAPAKKAKPSGRKGGAGLAILGGGAAFAALKNRDKLPGKLGGRSSEPETVTPMTPVTPVTPVTATTPVTNDDRPLSSES